MAVTIKEVAALAGVSPSTVSRTCKDNPSISRETKNRVRKAMAELGYEPPLPASGPQEEAGVHAIGVILPPSCRETYEN
ncbi:MAG: LacI family DNA-binding transcriptional regulator, partial [Gemmiger sp.]